MTGTLFSHEAVFERDPRYPELLALFAMSSNPEERTMGVDLKLLPLIQRDFWVSHDILRLNRDRKLWPAIDALPQRDIPSPLSCHEVPTPEGESLLWRDGSFPLRGAAEMGYSGRLNQPIETRIRTRQLAEPSGMGLPSRDARGLAHSAVLALMSPRCDHRRMQVLKS